MAFFFAPKSITYYTSNRHQAYHDYTNDMEYFLFMLPFGKRIFKFIFCKSLIGIVIIKRKNHVVILYLIGIGALIGLVVAVYKLYADQHDNGWMTAAKWCAGLLFAGVALYVLKQIIQ